MKRPSVPNPISPEQELTRNPPDSSYVLNVTAVYQDASTQAWAGQVAAQIRGLAGGETVCWTERRLSELDAPEVFCEAVSEAARADLIVVSVRAAEALPTSLYSWGDAWLRCRDRRRGALVALMASSDSSGPGLDRTREYLRALARQGHLDFLANERTLPAQPPGFSSPETAPLAPTLTRPVEAEDNEDQSSLGSCRWGINE